MRIFSNQIINRQQDSFYASLPHMSAAECLSECIRKPDVNRPYLGGHGEVVQLPVARQNAIADCVAVASFVDVFRIGGGVELVKVEGVAAAACLAGITRAIHVAGGLTERGRVVGGRTTEALPYATETKRTPHMI